MREKMKLWKRSTENIIRRMILFTKSQSLFNNLLSESKISRPHLTFIQNDLQYAQTLHMVVQQIINLLIYRKIGSDTYVKKWYVFPRADI